MKNDSWKQILSVESRSETYPYVQVSLSNLAVQIYTLQTKN